MVYELRNTQQRHATTDEEILSLISHCHNLEKLTLYGFTLNCTGMKMLTENTRLREIDLVSCHASSAQCLDHTLANSIGVFESMRSVRVRFGTSKGMLHKMLG